VGEERKNERFGHTHTYIPSLGLPLLPSLPHPSSNPYYLSTFANSPLIILFSEIFKFSKNIFFPNQKRENCEGK
jgi:hypothetical protein